MQQHWGEGKEKESCNGLKWIDRVLSAWQIDGCGFANAGCVCVIKAAPHGARTHLAFNAPSDEAVDAFYAAALANGGRGDGEPGLRKECGEHYYTCFVYDVDGHRLEAVYQWG